MSQVAELPFYACHGVIREGRARCRNKSLGGALLRCAAHLDRERAPAPDRIVWRINVKGDNLQRLIKAGIPRFTRTAEVRELLHARREARAEELGRDAFAARQEPGSPDDGCQVFGKDRLRNAGLSMLLEELRSAGFRITSTHILDDAKGHEGGSYTTSRWVMEFSGDRLFTDLKNDVATARMSDDPEARKWAERTAFCVEAVEKFPIGLLTDYWDLSFGTVDVWANGENDKEKIVHTITCGGEKRPIREAAHILHYNGGLWAVS